MRRKLKPRFRTIWTQVILILALLLAACVPTVIEPPSGGPVPVTRELSPTKEPTITPGATDTPTPYPLRNSLTTTPWPPDPFPTQTPVPPFPDLIFRTGEGLWRIDDGWQPALLSEQADAVLSPDGRQALYLQENDIWLIDLAGGDSLNLTGGSGRMHCCAQWWPSRPEVVVFGSWPVGSDLGPSTGFLSAVNVDGSGYVVLDEEIQSNALPAPGPDGQSIAYDQAGSSWLYRWEEGPQQFDPLTYDLQGVARIGGPSWSPNGRQLAWTVAVTGTADAITGGWQIALAVFDLNTETARLLHPYENAGRGGWFPPPVWSPDGQWLAFVAEDIDPDEFGLWVAAADGSEEQYLGPGANPAWSPDGRWLAFNQADPFSEDGTDRLVEVSSWYVLRMNLPPGAMIVSWPK